MTSSSSLHGYTWPSQNPCTSPYLTSSVFIPSLNTHKVLCYHYSTFSYPSPAPLILHIHLPTSLSKPPCLCSNASSILSSISETQEICKSSLVAYTTLLAASTLHACTHLPISIKPTYPSQPMPQLAPSPNQLPLSPSVTRFATLSSPIGFLSSHVHGALHFPLLIVQYMTHFVGALLAYAMLLLCL